MVKYAATLSRANRLGTLFVNPGGPGGSGSAMVHTAGSSLSALTGGRYDIVGPVKVKLTSAWYRSPRCQHVDTYPGVL
jgi:hypothetical protein